MPSFQITFTHKSKIHADKIVAISVTDKGLLSYYLKGFKKLKKQ